MQYPISTAVREVDDFASNAEGFWGELEPLAASTGVTPSLSEQAWVHTWLCDVDISISDTFRQDCWEPDRSALVVSEMWCTLHS